MTVSDTTRREVWVAAGGRCCLCKQPVDLGAAEAVAHFGDVAHIAGQGDGPRTPRRNIALAQEDVDSFENLLLLCPNDHRLADGKLKELYSDEALHTLKRSHEAAVSVALDYAFGQTQALVCKLSGPVQEGNVSVPGSETIAASLRDGLVPRRTSRHDHLGRVLDLPHLDDKVQFRQTSGQLLAEYVDAVRAAFHDGEFEVIAVFAFADLPSLVHLGYLMNELPIRPFQRDPASGSWIWATEEQTVEFGYDTGGLLQSENEVVLCMDISGTVDVTSLPERFRDLPVVRVGPRYINGHRHVMKSRADLDALRDVVVQLLGDLEGTCSTPLILHIVGPLPVSGAVIVGNALAHRAIQEIVLYDFDSDSYAEALRL